MLGGVPASVQLNARGRVAGGAQAGHHGPDLAARIQCSNPVAGLGEAGPLGTGNARARRGHPEAQRYRNSCENIGRREGSGGNAFYVCKHSHLHRLKRIWDRRPVCFVTTCTAMRRPILDTVKIHEVLRDEWEGMHRRHGWLIGRYVIMPDHVHFFASPLCEASRPLEHAIAKWKEWTARQCLRVLAAKPPFWQAGFFDHVLRSDESRSAKWSYVHANPVRAGLVKRPEDWPYAGSIDFD